MTLCIAALCDRSDASAERRVIVSFDSRVETPIASANTEFKLKRLSRRWIALLAGDLALAREIAIAYGDLLSTIENGVTEENALQHLYAPLNDVRAREADRYTQQRLAMPYAQFLNAGATQLPEDLFRQVTYDVAAQELNVELILVGWFEGYFHLYKLSCGRIYTSEPFAVIGSGGNIAEPALFQRSLRPFMAQDRVLYCVYEAQRLAEIAPGVGTRHSFAIFTYNDEEGRIYPLVALPDTLALLDERYRLYGPQPIGDVSLPAETGFRNYRKLDEDASVTGP
jgi:hypothetical protein